MSTSVQVAASHSSYSDELDRGNLRPRLTFFHVIFGDAFVDFRREFQILVNVAGIGIFRVRADGKLLVLLKFQNLLAAGRTVALAFYLLYQRATSFFIHVWIRLKLFEQLLSRQEV